MSEKESAILAATLHLVSQHGFHGTSMSMIAKEAGVSAGIIYHYFDNKDALMAALYGKIKRDMSRAILADYHESDPLRDRFRRILLNSLHFFMHHPAETAYLEQFANSPYCTPSSEAAYKQEFNLLEDLLQHAIREGVIKDVPFEMIMTFTSSVVMDLAKKHISGALVLGDTLQDLAVQMCWDALRT